MIIAETKTNTGFYYVHSTATQKEARITRYRAGSWTVQHLINGKHKHGFKSYQDCLEYLNKLGW